MDSIREQKGISEKFKKKSISNGFKVFIVLTLVGIGLTLFLTGSKQTWLSLRNFNWRFLPIVLGLLLFDFWLAAARLHVFTRDVGSGTRFWDCMRANWANNFLSAMTPFSSGGGFAQVWILSRAGTSISCAATVSIVNFVVTMFIFLIAIVFISIFGNFANQLLSGIVKFSSAIFYIGFIFLALFLVFPNFVRQAIDSALSVVASRFKKIQRKTLRIRKSCWQFISNYKADLKYFCSEKPSTIVWNALLNVILYLNKCLMAYFILRGMGFNIAFAVLFPICALLLFLLYFSPTPGGSLIAETSTAILMSTIIPVYLVSIFTLLWRFFSAYFSVVIGGFVVAREANRGRR
jgi:uncharacterized protein (TIRG00374 family)